MLQFQTIAVRILNIVLALKLKIRFLAVCINSGVGFLGNKISIRHLNDELVGRKGDKLFT